MQEEISIRDLIIKLKKSIEFFRERTYIILLSVCIGGLLGLGYRNLEDTIYTATLSFALEDDNGQSSASPLSGLASQFGFDVGGSAGGAFSGANLIELMKSRKVLTKTLLSPVKVENKEMSLIEFYLIFKKLRETKPDFYNVRFNANTNENELTSLQNEIIASAYGDILENMLSVSQKDKKVSIIYVEVKSANEIFSKFFAETLVKVVSDFYIETKSKKAKLNLEILQKQTDSIRRELNEAIVGVASANDNTFNLNSALNIKRVPSSRRQIDVQANSSMLTQLVQNLELAKVSLRKETPLIQIIDNPILPLVGNRIGLVKSVSVGALLALFIIISILFVLLWWKRITVES